MNAQELRQKLKTVADKKGYFLTGGRSEGFWLMWVEPTEPRLQDLFSAHFKPLNPLKPDPLGNCPYPVTPFQYELPEEEHSRQRALYERLSQRVRERTSDDEQFLATQVVALESSVRHSANRLRKPLRAVEKILKVWFAETEEVITERNEDPGSFFFSVYCVWENMKCGIERAAIENYDFSEDGTPFWIAQSVRHGLLYYHKEIHRIIQETVRIDLRRLAYEDLYHALLQEKPFLKWNQAQKKWQVDTSPRPTGSAHKHTMHMGKKVHKFRKEHKKDRGEGNPHLWQVDEIKDWLRKDMVNPDTEKPYSRGTVLRAAQETDCWVNTKQGRTAGLKESLDNLENYYLKHRQKSEKQT